MNAQVAAALPFSIASRYSSRESFSLPQIALSASTPTIAAGTPVQIPAVGYLKKLRLRVKMTATGGTPALTADAPFNVITSIALKNSAGQNLIAPLTGYELYQYNKLAGMGQGYASAYGKLGDPKVGRGYVATPASPEFFIDVPVELDPSTGLGAIPALASNRAYQLDISFAAISTVFGGTPPTAVTVSVTATAHYWDVPVASTPGGVAQSTEPFGLGTLSLMQKETANISQGDQLTRFNNTGNVIRNLILIARKADGSRTDVDLPTISELYVDNNPMLRFGKAEWQDAMVRWYGLDAAALDAAGGLDTGVMVIPFHLLAGGLSGDPSNAHAQFLATLDATLLQFKGYDWGANVSTLTVLTQAIASPNPQFIYSK